MQDRGNVPPVELLHRNAARAAREQHTISGHDGAAQPCDGLVIADLSLGEGVEDNRERRGLQIHRRQVREHVVREVVEDLHRGRVLRHAARVRVHDDSHGLRVEILGGEQLHHVCQVQEKRAVADLQARKAVEHVLDMLGREGVGMQAAHDAREVLHELHVMILHLGARVDNEGNTL